MTPNDILNKHFDKSAMGGYRVEDVNAFMISVGDYTKSLVAERDELQSKMEILADKLEEYREDEDSLRAALIGAQKLGDSVVKESKKKAETIIAEAEKQAMKIVMEAKMKADALGVDAKRNLDNETHMLNKMQAEVARFKTQIMGLYRQHIELLNNIPVEAEKPPQAAAAVLPKQEPAPTVVNNAPDDVLTAVKPDGEDEVIKLEFHEEIVDSIVEEETGFPRRSASRFGTLRFGDEYKLTREE